MSIPFNYTIHTQEDQENAVKEIKGILSFTGDEILFEYKVYSMEGDSIGTLQKFSLAPDLIKKFHFKKGFFKNGIIIETKRTAFLDPVPGSKQGKIELYIKKRDRDEAIRFSTRMNLYLSQLLEEE